MDKPIQLSIVGIVWPPETFIQRKIDKLLEQGFHITVWTAKSQSVKKSEALSIRYLPTKPQELLWPLLFLLLFHPKQFWEAIKLSQERKLSKQATLLHLMQLSPFATAKADIIHFEWNTHAIIYLSLAEWLKSRMVVSCRGAQVQIAPNNPLRPELYSNLNESFEKATVVHCVSQAIMEDAIRLGMSAEKARIICPAVDPSFFEPMPRSQNSLFTIITIGNLIWRKGYEYLLVAMKVLKEAGLEFQLLIVGTGDDTQRIQFTIDDLCLHEQVKLLGKCSPAEIRQHLQGSDVFVLSSLSEGISNAVLEAMACGLPVVTTDCGGMREALSDAQEGFVVPMREPKAMAEALMKLAQEPNLRISMGKAARQRILQDFTLELQSQQFVKLYQDIL